MDTTNTKNTPPRKTRSKIYYIILVVVISSYIFLRMSVSQETSEVQPWRPPNPGLRWIKGPTPTLNQTTASTSREHHATMMTSVPTIPPQPPSYANVTNADYSFYTIIDYKTNYSLCETVTITIQAKISQNIDKTCGGDFIWAWVSNATQRASAVAEEIIDHNNGTYTVKIIPRWIGRSEITISLVHSSEIVSHLSYFREHYPARYSYKGIFKQGNVKESCHVTTDMYIPVKERYPNMTFCNFTNEETGFPWFCLKPVNVSCDQYYIHTSGGSANEFHKSIMSKEFVKNYKSPHLIRALNASNADIVVYADDESVSSTTCSSTEIPACTPGHHSKHSKTAPGFYFNDTWTSLVCNNTHFTTSDILQCLQNKTIHFIGDSTLRQWYEYLVRFALKDNLQERKGANAHFGPHSATSIPANISIDFKFHGYPMALGNISTNQIHYVAEQLDSYKDLENITIVLSIWAHFTGTNIDYYTKRLQSVQDAITRLRKRNSNIRIFVKSANTREYSSDFDRSNWYSWEVDKVMHNMMAGFPGVTILDVWDMTIGHRTGYNLHPGPLILAQEIDLFLSYLCSND